MNSTDSKSSNPTFRKESSLFTTRILQVVLCVVCVLLAAACVHHDDYAPKPRAYMRIDMPQHQYTTYDTSAIPFRFDYANDAVIVWKKNTPSERWIDICYPQYKGIVFLSYERLRSPNDLPEQINNAYNLLKTHFDFSSGVDEKQYENPTAHVYANTYHLKGPRVASTFQWWATDSNRHFIRAALYLNQTPNNDSLAPVLQYLQEDMQHLIESLEWTD